MRSGEPRPSWAIEDHAIIGDGRTAALVTHDGTLDWLCWPRFDSPPLFDALLGGDACWRLSPAAPFETARRYVGPTNVLETRFRTAEGQLTVTDFMPVRSEADKRASLAPTHEVIRVARCASGTVELDCSIFESSRGAWRPAGGMLRLAHPEGLLVLRAPGGVRPQDDRTVRGHVRLCAGEAVTFSLSFATDAPAVLPAMGDAVLDTLSATLRWWERWSAQITYAGPERDAVLRSALVLKLLVHAPSGAVVAAPTTSLPERVGGDLNWDYRYCWLRDASLTMRALVELGFRSEAEAFLGWLLYSTRLRGGAGATHAPLCIAYDVFGNPLEHEEEIDLPGYRGSRPVRTGNAAALQLQLDVFGELVDAAAQVIDREGEHDEARMLQTFADYVCEHWDERDAGIWEPRGAPEAHTHSRVLCWTALDRMLALADALRLPPEKRARYARERARLREVIDHRAWSDRERSYVATLDGADVDASLLRIAWYGFDRADSARMQATWRRVERELGAPGGLLYRNRDFFPAGEGAFGICGFWGAEFLALGGGTYEEAGDRFASLCRLANDVGLFGEEIEPRTGAALGNFPQAFTHVGLINAGVTLAHRARAPGECLPRRPAVTRGA